MAPVGFPGGKPGRAWGGAPPPPLPPGAYPPPPPPPRVFMVYTNKLHRHLTPYNDWLLPNSIKLSLHNLCIALCEVSIRQWAMYQPTDSHLPKRNYVLIFLIFTKCMKNCHYSCLQSGENWELTQDFTFTFSTSKSGLLSSPPPALLMQ